MTDIKRASPDLHEKEGFHDVEEVALQGHVATDAHGNPLVQIDHAAERRLRNKIAIHVLPIMVLMYLFCFIDRANIGNARIAGLLTDIGARGRYDYNIILTAFYAPYAVSEPFFNMMCKRVGPSRFLPVATVAFGFFSLCTGLCKSFAPMIVVRVLLGLAEAGVFPGMAYYLGRWFRKNELPAVFAIYVIGAPLAGAFGGLLASGILKIAPASGYFIWSNLFWIEGGITMVIGVASWFIMTESPETASWLSHEEKILAAARIKSENVGASVVLDKISKKAYFGGVLNVTTLTNALIFLLDNITVQGLGFFLPTIIRTIYPRKTLIQQQLRTVPPYIVGAFFSTAWPFLSWRLGRRGIIMVVSAPLVVAGFAMFVGTINPQIRYGATFLITAGAYSFGSLCNGWAAANTTSDTARNGAIATVVMAGNFGGLVATWSYLASDAPNYFKGNSLNIGTSTSMFFLAGGLLIYQKIQNKRKEAGHHDHELEGKTQAEIELLGQAHPGFRYRY